MERKVAHRRVERDIACCAASQDGVVALGQLLGMGLSRGAGESRLRRGVETDGRAAHRTAVAFERDRAREAHLTAAGYRVVRYTSLRLTRQPADVTRELRVLLTPRSP